MSDELLVQATTAGAEVIAEEWRNQVRATRGLGPGTAHYAEAIGIRARPGKHGATAWVGLPNNVPTEEGEAHPRDYAPRLEFGGYVAGYRAAKPTLRPAFESTKVRALDAMAAKIRELIERVADLT